MAIALAKNDKPEFLDALEINLALARISQHQPFLIDTLVGLGIESLTYHRIYDALASGPDPEFLAAIDAIVARQRHSCPRRLRIRRRTPLHPRHRRLVLQRPRPRPPRPLLPGAQGHDRRG